MERNTTEGEMAVRGEPLNDVHRDSLHGGTTEGGRVRERGDMAERGEAPPSASWLERPPYAHRAPLPGAVLYCMYFTVLYYILRTVQYMLLVYTVAPTLTRR